MSGYIAIYVLPTGPIPWRDQVLALSAVRFDGRRVTGRFDTLIRPARRPSRVLLGVLGAQVDELDSAPRFGEIEPQLRELLADDPLIGFGIKVSAEFLAAELSRINAPGLGNSLIELANLAADRGVILRKPGLEHLAAALGLTLRTPGQPKHAARLTAQVAARLLEMPDQADDRPSGSGTSILPDRWALLDPVRVRHIAETPGVYVFRDRDGEMLYAGSSGNLRRRLTSYQSRPLELDRRLEGLAERVWDIETRPTAGLLEALISEASLIAEYAPSFNVQRQTRMPRRYLRAWLGPGASLRPVSEVMADGATYIGPFVSGSRALQALQLVRLVYPLLGRKVVTVTDESPSQRRRQTALQRQSDQLARAQAIRDAVRLLCGQREAALREVQSRAATAARLSDHSESERLRQLASAIVNFEMAPSPLADGAESRFAVISLDRDEHPRVMYHLAGGAILERCEILEATDVEVHLQRWRLNTPVVQVNLAALPLIVRWIAMQGKRCRVVPLPACSIQP
ncbi:MAG: hypothetical protein ACKVVP_17550 [Chloroflexota bacterium]